MKAHAGLFTMLLALQGLPAATHAQTAEERALQQEDESDGMYLRSDYDSAYAHWDSPGAYSVEKIRETVKTLPDGNQVRTRDSSMYYRDGKGRVRIVYRTYRGEERTFIADPAARLAYLVRNNRHDVLRIKGDPPPRRYVAMYPRPIRVQEWSRKVETPLGVKEIEGLKAVGSRTETFYPAGAKGNEREMVETQEVWRTYAIPLPGYLYSRDSSPITGDRINRYENLKMGDVPESMFAVPADLPVRDLVLDSPPAPE